MLVKKGIIKVGKRKDLKTTEQRVVQDIGTGRPPHSTRDTPNLDTYGTTVSEKDLRTS